MEVAVIIPWRAGCERRQRALSWVTRQLDDKHPDWPVILGEHNDGEWCKAKAVEHGLSQTGADAIIIHDADVWVPNLAETVASCKTWAIPHLIVHRLDEPATDLLIRTGQPGPGRDRRPYRGFAGGGVTVVMRHVYEECPIDQRFVGWGQEDASWAKALDCIYGPANRGTADLIHLWHPPQPRVAWGTGSYEGKDLERRYRSASRHPDVMRGLIAEARGTGPTTRNSP